MRVTIVAVVVGVVVGLALGGRLRHLPADPLRQPVLLVVAAALHLSLALWDASGGVAVAGVLCAYAALLGFVAANLRLVGMPVVLLGLGLNAAVVLANQGMPVDGTALVAAGVASPEELPSLDLGPARQLRGPADPVAVLGDIVPVPPLNEVVSFGDLILAAGLANVSVRLLRPVGRPEGRPSRRYRRKLGPARLLALSSPAR